MFMCLRQGCNCDGDLNGGVHVAHVAAHVVVTMASVGHSRTSKGQGYSRAWIWVVVCVRHDMRHSVKV